MQDKLTLAKNPLLSNYNPNIIERGTLLEREKNTLYDLGHIQPAKRINSECYSEFIQPSRLERSLVWGLAILIVVCFWVQVFKWVGVL